MFFVNLLPKMEFLPASWTIMNNMTPKFPIVSHFNAQLSSEAEKTKYNKKINFIIEEELNYKPINFDYVKVTKYEESCPNEQTISFFIQFEDALRFLWDLFQFHIDAQQLSFESDFRASGLTFSKDRGGNIFFINLFGWEEEAFYYQRFEKDTIPWFIMDKEEIPPSTEFPDNKLMRYLTLFELFIAISAFQKTLEPKKRKVIYPLNWGIRFSTPMESQAILEIYENYSGEPLHYPLDSLRKEPKACLNQIIEDRNLLWEFQEISRKEFEKYKTERVDQAYLERIATDKEFALEQFKKIQREREQLIHSETGKKNEEKCIQRHRLAMKIRRHYLDLIKTLYKHKDKIFRRIEQLEQARKKFIHSIAKLENLTILPSNILPVAPYMTVSPAIRLIIPDDASLIHQPLRLNRATTSSSYQELEVRNDFNETIFFPTSLIQTVQNIFKLKQVPWILPLAFTGLSKIYQDQDMFQSAMELETSATNFWSIIRPNQVDRIKKKGLKGILGNDLNPTDLFLWVINLFRQINFPYIYNKTGEKGFILGLIQVSKVWHDSKSRVWIKWRFNPEVLSLMQWGKSAGSYMYVNYRAMFSYSRKVLATAPALQLYIEELIRNQRPFNPSINLCLKSNGISIKQIAHQIGLDYWLNKGQSSVIRQRIINTFEHIKKAGVLESFKTIETGNIASLNDKIVFKCHLNYAKAYKTEKCHLDSLKTASRKADNPFSKRDPGFELL